MPDAIRFSNDNENDQCGCRCYNSNGVIVLLVAQILMFIAACFSTAAVLDCQFVVVDSNKVDPALAEIFRTMFNKTVPVEANNDKRGLGFFFYEGVDGECTWDHFEDWSDTVDSNDMEDLAEDGFEAYRDFLGSDWKAPRAMAVVSTVLGWIYVCWLLTFSCVSHFKVIRWTLGALIIASMAAFQGSTFAVLQSDICDEHDCDLGRSSRLGIAALVLAVVAGFLVFFTKDHPGEQSISSSPKHGGASVTEAHQGDEEAHDTPPPVDSNATEIQEVVATIDVDEALFDMSGKKSFPVVTE